MKINLVLVIFVGMIVLIGAANAASLNVYGDSFTDTSTVNGITYGGKYPKLLANMTNYTTIINLANSGTAITDTFTLEDVYKYNIYGHNDSLTLFGYNDMRLKKNTSTNLTAYNETLEAILIFLTLDNSSKVFANNSDVSFGGTWTPQTVYGRSVYYTNQIGANVSFNITGTQLFIGSVKGFNAGYTDISKSFNVTVDGVIVGNYTGNTAFVSPAGTAVHPFLISITGLTNTFHEVKINYNGSGAASANIRFDWYSNKTTPAHKVFAGNTVRMLDYLASPTAPYGSDIAVSEHNQINSYVVTKLNSEGFNKIYYVDVNSSYDPNIHIGADEVHPNAAGFTAIANAFYAVILSSIPSPPASRQELSDQNTNNFISASITLLIFILIISPVISRTPTEYRSMLALVIAAVGITFIVIYMSI